ncbi:hypothetical protein MMMDOFMJ_0720 [Methylobacterium gnaphalii]|uniref:Uncharacterized protein n=1 Tax=Methylobacterium gnaphalii TaxID=1010610 RepID=A0A512JI27_9HYPH|nr:hypothetical protein MGN01_14550 [Methylobacterium gnaphalii]GJD67803.1 hypothetical protein MMMDOFMJ_0720 [Methylobacterium gnaphalii]GLS51807.1 hypothetical protein GCM10007885_46690 [Methylobacterium gnaphalii]
MTAHSPIETKSASPLTEHKAATGAVDAALEGFARAFEAFKEANDTRLGEIETRLSADVLTEEKLARIDTALDEARFRLDRISLDRARPPLAGSDGGRATSRAPSIRLPSISMFGPARARD